jgi:hypothetical protein
MIAIDNLTKQDVGRVLILALMERTRKPRLKIVCMECGRVFYERYSKHRKFCSKKCGAIHTNRKFKLPLKCYICELCGKGFDARSCRKGVKYCSFRCGQIAKARSQAKQRYYDKIRGTGKKTKYIKFKGRHLHRVVAEQKLGRPLKKGEIVHHKDWNSRNNAPENIVITTLAEHGRIHSTKNRKCSVVGCERKHLAKGFCSKHYEEHRIR